MNKKEIKNNAYKNLEIINDWINNSDNKTSAEDLYSKKIIEEDTFEDLQDTYEYSKNHDYKRDKDDFEMEI